MTVYLMIAVNDADNGAFTGRARGFNFDYPGSADIALSLENNDWNGDMVCRRVGADRLRIGRRVFSILSYGTWIGNWCWDGVTVENHVAQAIAEYLRATGKWHPDMGYAELWDAWDSDAPIVFEEQAQ
jgi:hypothetical protein